jgi:hypothetical protein
MRITSWVFARRLRNLNPPAPRLLSSYAPGLPILVL